jgi:hypothetical protein
MLLRNWEVRHANSIDKYNKTLLILLCTQNRIIEATKDIKIKSILRTGGINIEN